MTIQNRQLAKIIKRCQDLPGYELFQYVDDDGQRYTIESDDVNKYLQKIAGQDFTAKDFRTWAGTLVCACALARDGNEIPVQKVARNKRIVAAIKETAEVLGNTPAVCRGSYVCPEVINGFEKGRVLDTAFEKLDDLIAFRGHGLHKAEQSLLKFLKRSAK